MKPFGFYNHYYRKGAVKRLLGLFFGEPHFGYWLRFNYIRQFLNKKKETEPYNIIDVGTAQGQTAIWLAEHFPKSNITSIEINPSRVENAERLIGQIGLQNITIVNKDILNFDQSKKYHLIICSDVLEHIPLWQKAVDKMIDLLEKDGEIFIHVPSNLLQFQSEEFGFRKQLQVDDYNSDKNEIGEAHFRDGLSLTDFDYLVGNPNIAFKATYTFSRWTMKLHTLFEYFKVKNPKLLFPLVPVLGWFVFENRVKLTEGGGIKVIIKKL
jgi:SAM-dependent methyltransferase